MEKEQIIAWLRVNDIQFDERSTMRQLEILTKEKGAELEETFSGNMSELSLSEGQSVIDAHVAPIQRDLNAKNNLKAFKAEEEIVEAEINLLEKRKLLVNLRGTCNKNRAEVNDVISAILPFSGEQTSDATKWINDFERTCNTLDGDD